MEPELDSKGNAVLALERKSVQPYRTQDEYLYAMKEDLAEWFNTLYSSGVTTEDFFEYLETGVALCQHANNVNGHIVKQIQGSNQPINGHRDTLEFAQQVIQFKASVKPGSFQCRDNISNYIHWCRQTLGIPDTLLFESDDLVLRKNERNVVLCVLEVARRGARYGVLAPVLIQMEEEIDAEIAGEEPPPRPQQPPRPRRTNDMMSLDEMVREIARNCTCPDEFPIIRVSEGKYKVGEALTLIFVRILRNHVMVRIGGGWDTLENYLNRHDPCRCNGNKIQHKTQRYATSAVKRKPSMTSTAPNSEVNRSPRQLPVTPTASQTPNGIDGNSPKTDLVRRNSSVTARSVDRLRSDENSPGKLRPQSAKTGTSRPQSPIVSRRRGQSPLPGGRPSSPSLSRRPQSPAPSGGAPSPAGTPSSRRASHSNQGSSPDSVTSPTILRTEPFRPQPRRPTSAGPCSQQNQTPTKPTFIAKPQPKRPGSAAPGTHSRTLTQEDQPIRKRSPSRDTPRSQPPRSQSVGADELRRRLLFTNDDVSNDPDVLMISRDKSGRHIINKPEEDMSVMMLRNNGSINGVGNSDRRLNSARMKISPDKLLPSKPILLRSQSSETSSDKSAPTSPYSSGPTTPSGPSLRRQASVGSLNELSDIPAPNADHKLYKEMEKVFEQYRRAEKGWLHYDAADEEVDMLSASASSSQSAPGGVTNRPQSAGVSQSCAPSTPRTSNQLRNGSVRSRNPSITESSSSSPVADRSRPMTPTTRRSRPVTPSAQRRCITPTPTSSKPLSVAPTARRGSVTLNPQQTRSSSLRRDSFTTGANTNQISTAMRGSASSTPVARSASLRESHGRSSPKPMDGTHKRAQTPNPTTGQVRVQARCRTPVIQARTENVQSRIDTGLKRSTTPKPDLARQPRSSSLSRAAITKDLLGQTSAGGAFLRARSRSREDILDGENNEHRSRADSNRNRDNVLNAKQAVVSRHREVNANQTPAERELIREPPRTLPPTPGMMTLVTSPTGSDAEPPDIDQITNESLYSERREIDYVAKPRKDDRVGTRTRIPRPSSARRFQSPKPEGSLKRFDSGVDINISPTESGIIHDDMYSDWEHPEGISVAGDSNCFSLADDEYY